MKRTILLLLIGLTAYESIDATRKKELKPTTSIEMGYLLIQQDGPSLSGFEMGWKKELFQHHFYQTMIQVVSPELYLKYGQTNNGNLMTGGINVKFGMGKPKPKNTFKQVHSRIPKNFIYYSIGMGYGNTDGMNIIEVPVDIGIPVQFKKTNFKKSKLLYSLYYRFTPQKIASLISYGHAAGIRIEF